jgi:hypothetical protein
MRHTLDASAFDRWRRSFLCICVGLTILFGTSVVRGLTPGVTPPIAPPKSTNKAAPADAAALDRQLLSLASKNSDIMTNLTYLSDIIGARLTGSEALKRANQWTADKMRSYGLANVHLEPWSIPVGWQRGYASARIIEPDNGHSLSVAAAGWTPGTNGPVSGEVVIVKAKESSDLAAYKGKLKNAIVMRGEPDHVRPVTETAFDWDSPTRRNGRPGGANAFNLEQMRKMMAFRNEMAEFMRNEGALAILSDAGKPQGLLNMGGGWHGSDRASATDSLPLLYMAHEDYSLVYRLATRPAPARTRLQIDVKNTFIPGPIVVYNTVGEIRGSEKSDQYVVLGAHLDSWDLGQGTTDNGTGTCVVLEAARILANSGIQPKRTIRFVLFTGEEQGLYGSKDYVEKHKDELARISMCLVHDLGTGRVKGIGLMGHAADKPILDEQLATLKELGVTDISLRRMGGSDHASFDRSGVPGFYCQQDSAEYRFTHHSQSDTLDKAHEADLVQGAEVMAITGLRVANLPDLLPRDKK